MKISNPTAVLGEELAAKFLKKKGFKIIDRNFRLGYGELDIVGIYKGTLVFVEVKTRTTGLYGSPAEQISYFKLKSLVKTAQFYKSKNPKLPDALRIDAVSVLLDNSGKMTSIEHIENITG
jgi:putative endonuclease